MLPSAYIRARTDSETAIPVDRKRCAKRVRKKSRLVRYTRRWKTSQKRLDSQNKNYKIWSHLGRKKEWSTSVLKIFRLRQLVILKFIYHIIRKLRKCRPKSAWYCFPSTGIASWVWYSIHTYIRARSAPPDGNIRINCGRPYYEWSFPSWLISLVHVKFCILNYSNFTL